MKRNKRSLEDQINERELYFSKPFLLPKCYTISPFLIDHVLLFLHILPIESITNGKFNSDYLLLNILYNMKM